MTPPPRSPDSRARTWTLARALGFTRLIVEVAVTFFSGTLNWRNRSDILVNGNALPTSHARP